MAILKRRTLELNGRLFELRAENASEDGYFLQVAVFENGREVSLIYPGGIKASPMYTLSFQGSGDPVGPQHEATIDSLMETAETDFRRQMARCL